MARVFGFQFRGVGTALLFVGAAALVMVSWHALIARSLRMHPQVARKTVVEHCRYRVGQTIRDVPSDLFVARLSGCERFQVVTLDAAGGLIRPVMLKVALEPEPEFPLAEKELVFRSVYSNLSLGDSLHGLATGKWAFNPYNVYSQTSFTLTP